VFISAKHKDTFNAIKIAAILTQIEMIVNILI